MMIKPKIMKKKYHVVEIMNNIYIYIVADSEMFFDGGYKILQLIILFLRCYLMHYNKKLKI
jgi:hypothetical protein